MTRLEIIAENNQRQCKQELIDNELEYLRSRPANRTYYYGDYAYQRIGNYDDAETTLMKKIARECAIRG